MGQALTRLSLQEFLDWENDQPERHEFHRGEVFAMVGARRVHGTIALNIAASLKSQLKGSRCQVFADSMKVRVAADTIFYPDVFVTCDAADLRTEQVFTAPSLVVEVLSPSTELWDRNGKFTLYRSLASLREYLLVHPDTREVHLFRRGADELFTLHDLTGRERVQLDSIGCELLAIDVFDGVDPAAEQPASLPG
ncbi:Uma2 family endonuclease [soil metagenome]